jgi:hypothetical protein
LVGAFGSSPTEVLQLVHGPAREVVKAGAVAEEARQDVEIDNGPLNLKILCRIPRVGPTRQPKANQLLIVTRGLRTYVTAPLHPRTETKRELWLPRLGLVT